MELKDLIGLHELSGVDTGVVPADKDVYPYEDSETFSFVLDGKTYTAVQDPSDGYRSSMADIAEGGEVKNTFAPQKVMATMLEATPGDYETEHDVLTLTDVVTGKEVLRVGTGNTDDYYPYWVAWFGPEGMACNSQQATSSAVK